MKLESRVSIQEKEAAKNRVVDAILIQKRVQALEAEDDHVLQLNTKAFVADGNLHEKHLRSTYGNI
ncbi:hypothetical protein KY290_023024 [Solanum tuberosum]|uniref:Uncharacterized protein n=2 Tax=Solanum tuberosum TaxID=4113 RepID=A0ABQ7V804_SOLTU|nr:hypothetical protein KY290_023024 [Solanum tuberosum]